MNNRIEELLKQSTHDIMGVNQVDQKQFAELIVQECVSQLNIPDVPDPISAGLNLGKIAIKQHFGVE